MQTYTGGHAPAPNASMPKFSVTQLLHCLPSPCLIPGLIHADLVGTLPPSQGFTYILTGTDQFTRWPEAVPNHNISAETVAQSFVYIWVSRFGFPSIIIMDHGRQFESNLWGHSQPYCDPGKLPQPRTIPKPTVWLSN